MALTACSALGACSQSEVPATQLLLKVWPSADETTVFTRIDVSVSDPGASDRAAAPASRFYVARPGASKRAGEVTLPFSVGIVRTSANKVRIAVSGYAKNEEGVVRVVERKIDTRFQNERTVSADVTLDAICVGEGAVCADDDATCYALAAAGVEAGRCGPVPFLQGEVTPAGTEPAGPPVESDSALPVETTVAGDASIDADGEPEVIEGGADHSTMADAAAGDASTLPMTPEIPAESSTETLAPELPPGYVACGKAGMCPQSFPCLESDEGGYTCAGQYADWPIPNGGVAGGRPAWYAVLSNGELTYDRVTGLLWQRNIPSSYPGCTGVDSKAEQKQPGTACTFKEAKAYCQQLNLDGKRWRLPSRTELMSLIDTSHADLKRQVYTTDPYAFPTDLNRQLHFWASNESEPGDRSFVPSMVWLLVGGAAILLNQDANVKCVHSIFSGSSTPEDHFQRVPGSDFVLDTRTHLEWERSVPDTSLTYADAVVRCHNLGERFRIPSARELISLYGEVRFIHQLHPAFVPGSSVSIFWTSDYNITDPADHLVVFGTVGTVDPSSAIEETIRMTNATGNGEVAPPIFVARCVRTAAD